MANNYRELFETFLGSVGLKSYREKYYVKIVEMNLPRKIQVLGLIYKIYWVEKRFIDFEEFYKEYLEKCKEYIEAFRIKTTICDKCFTRGLKARIYRTWASIITQIQGGYVAESVFGKGNVEMSEELDRKGADIRVEYKGHKINFQVKKETLSGVIGRGVEPENKIDGDSIDLPYFVPIDTDFKNNGKKNNGEYRVGYIRSLKKLEEMGLKRFSNGFIIFTSVPFEKEKRKIDSEK